MGNDFIVVFNVGSSHFIIFLLSLDNRSKLLKVTRQFGDISRWSGIVDNTLPVRNERPN